MEVHALDLNFQGIPETIASYLVVGPDGPVLVETGPGSTLGALEAALAQRGFALREVQHVFVTHIHLDHAGAAGALAEGGATLYVHRFGAPHLIDPSRLLASATRIYGDQMDTLWGTLRPAPAERVRELDDGDVVEAAGLQITALETPGHARHHHVLIVGGAAFTGDIGGVRLPGPDHLDLPAPPPEFHAEAWDRSLDLLRGRDLDVLYPTHFGPVRAVDSHLEELRALVREAADVVRAGLQRGLGDADLVAAYREWNSGRAARHGLSAEWQNHYEAVNPAEMSAHGIARYWRKRGLPATG